MPRVNQDESVAQPAPAPAWTTMANAGRAPRAPGQRSYGAVAPPEPAEAPAPAAESSADQE